MVEAAIQAGYEEVPWNPMRTAKNLSSLFEDPRFQKICCPTKPARKK